MHDLRVDERLEETSLEEGGVIAPELEAEWDAMDVDELVELVLQSTGRSERYNWRAVIEGGRRMSGGRF